MVKFCPNCGSSKLSNKIKIGGKLIAQHCQGCKDCEHRFMIIETFKPRDEQIRRDIKETKGDKG
jgi:DNA-directed RNA polymerase subunit M/transcription elongation factor TFIIS